METEKSLESYKEGGFLFLETTTVGKIISTRTNDGHIFFGVKVTHPKRDCMSMGWVTWDSVNIGNERKHGDLDISVMFHNPSTPALPQAGSRFAKAIRISLETIRKERATMPWISSQHLNLFDTDTKTKATITQMTKGMHQAHSMILTIFQRSSFTLENSAPLGATS